MSDVHAKIFAYKFAAADARIRLGDLRRDQGDLDSAFKYYQDAAWIGHQIAKYKVAQAYLEGRGVRRDYVHAYAWLSLTASYAQGAHSEDAARALDRIETRMTPQMIAQGQKLAKELDDTLNEYRRAHKLEID